jgi:hypothetical protein
MSIQFETRPVRRSRGPNPTLLVAVGLVAFVVVAVLKPWDRPAPASAPVPAPTAAPSLAAALPSPASPSDGPAGAPGETDWTPQLTAILRDHGPEISRSVSLGWQLGIRSITWKGLFPGTSIPTAPLYGSMLEWWYPARSGNGSNWDSAPLEVVAPSVRAPVLALGLTTALGDDALDVRLWRLTEQGAIRLTPIEVSGPGADARLFLPPTALAPSGGWPHGRYVVEALLGSGIVAIPFTIGDPQPEAVPPLTRLDPPDVDGIAATLSAPGPFVVGDDGAVTARAAAATQRMDPAQAWLAIGAPLGHAGPLVARFEGAAPAALGVALAQGSVLEAASLWGIAPHVGRLPALQLVNPARSAYRFVAFATDDGRPWPAGMYAITARYRDATGRALEQSWHVDVGGDPAAPVPLLLRGAAGWASRSGHWAVLSTVGSAGTTRTVGETLAAARDPETAALRPERLGAMCPGSAHIDRASRLIGVAFPPDAGVSALRLVRRYAGGASELLDVPSTLLPGTGLGLFAAPAAAHGTWAEGYYDVVIALSPGLPLYLPLCIGRDAGSAFLFRVDPRSAVAPGARAAAAAAAAATAVRPAPARPAPSASGSAYVGPGGVMAGGAMVAPVGTMLAP